MINYSSIIKHIPNGFIFSLEPRILALGVDIKPIRKELKNNFLSSDVLKKVVSKYNLIIPFKDYVFEISKINEDSFLATKVDTTSLINYQEINSISSFPKENPNPIMRFSTSGKILLYANESAKKVIRFLDKISEGNKNMLQDFLKEVQQKQTILEKELSLGNKIFLIKAIPHFEEGFINVYCSDITTIINTQHLLKKVQQGYEEIIEEADDIIYHISPTGIFTYTNPKAQYILGYSKEELEGMSFTSLVREDFVINSSKFYLTQIKTRTEKTYLEIPILSKEGKEIWIGQKVKLHYGTNGEITHLSAISRDITAKKIAEIKLKRSEEKYRNIIDGMQLGLLEVDENNLITVTSKQFTKMTGFTHNDLIGKNADFLLADEKSIKDMKFQNEQRLAGKSGLYEAKIKKKNGEIIWTLISGSPIYDANKNIIGTVGIHLDISDRKKMIQDLIEAKEKAESSAKAKEMFLANTSHEIRTPLNTILGMTNLISQDQLNSKQNYYLETINESAQSLIRIINDILDASKISSGELNLEENDFSLQTLIESVKNNIEYKLTNRDISFKINTNSPSNLVLKGDEYRLRQIFLNLLTNACRFTEKGSIIVDIDYSNEENLLKFKVSDTGIGIKKENFESIFKSFKQAENSTTRKYGGTGLGLSISKSLVELMNGAISVESNYGVGSTFTVIIPIKKGIVKSYTQNLANEIEKQLSILLVEDHEINRFIAEQTLSGWGHKIDTAENGKEAVEKVASNNYDLVLMDISMPVMDGIEATKKIRTNLKSKLPIIALTANAMKGDEEKYLKAGMNGYVAKPFDPEYLKEKINSLCYSEYSIENNVVNSIEKNTINPTYFNLKAIYEIAPNDDVLVEKMIKLFVEQMPQSIEEIKTHLKNQNFVEAGNTAHKIKPTIKLMGLDNIVSIIASFETTARNNLSNNLDVWLTEIEQTIQLAINEMKSIYNLN